MPIKQKDSKNPSYKKLDFDNDYVFILGDSYYYTDSKESVKKVYRTDTKTNKTDVIYTSDDADWLFIRLLDNKIFINVGDDETDEATGLLKNIRCFYYNGSEFIEINNNLSILCESEDYIFGGIDIGIGNNFIMGYVKKTDFYDGNIENNFIEWSFFQ